MFAVDQQPYLQGYMAVASLWLYLTNGNDIGGGGPVLTGPSFVDSTNIDADRALRAEQHALVRSGGSRRPGSPGARNPSSTSWSGP